MDIFNRITPNEDGTYTVTFDHLEGYDLTVASIDEAFDWSLLVYRDTKESTP